MDIAIGLFQEMNQRDLAEKLLAEQEKGIPSLGLTLLLASTGYKQEYREHAVQEFCCYKEVNARLGENLSISRR
ncbi:hypothetical protein Q9233_008950 [Columba guinea]|nr:hypothetical protein Q9233_008950 [Columba guinea]